MATKVFRTDDLNDELIEDDVKPVTFTIEGAAYEIDLTAANRKVLLDFLATYTAAGRTKGGRVKRNAADHTPRPAGAASTATTGGQGVGYDQPRPQVNTVAIRAWAAENWPEPVADKGRVPTAVVAAYEAAQLAQQIAPEPPAGAATTGSTEEEVPIAPVDPSQIPAPEGIFAVPDPV